uniref:Telomerase reverse transcriptase n=1 Tax=Oryza meridionalis TaxID=40149 RepID=A0A0E0FBG5_9ORYZ
MEVEEAESHGRAVRRAAPTPPRRQARVLGLLAPALSRAPVRPGLCRPSVQGSAGRLSGGPPACQPSVQGQRRRPPIQGTTTSPSTVHPGHPDDDAPLQNPASNGQKPPIPLSPTGPLRCRLVLHPPHFPVAMPRRRRRRAAPGGQVPPELRLAYGARALTLGRAVFSLLPSPRHRESPCPACRGRVASGCLACRRWEHLLRDGDPVAYRRLITRAVCAIAADDLSAPPPPRYTPGNSGHSQARLVREMMKSIVADQSHGTKNVLCNGLHEGGQSICISDLVSSSSWSILLHRIGDLLMCYLLRSLVFHSMWFCEILYLQVLLRENINPKLQKQNVIHTCKIVTQQSCETCGSIRRAESKDPSEGCNCPKFPSDGRSEECCNCYTHNTRKRKRLYSWQRRSKKKQVCSVDESSAEWSKLNGSNFNMSNGPSENLAGKMNDQAQSVELTVDNNSLARSNDDSSSEIEVINATILSSEKSPCSVFDIRGSQGLSCHYSLSEVQYQSTCPQVGPSSYLHLNSCSICFNCIISNASKHLSLDSLISRNEGQPIVSSIANVAPDVTKNDGKAHYPPGGKAAYYDRSFSRLEAYSTHQQVASFVWAVLKRIVPKPLLGNSFGKRSLRTNIWKFIKLRRFETFQLSDCIGDLKGTICRVLKEQFHHLLYEQIKCNILKIGQKYYLQQVGIAQGSKLSPNLCSLYYGHLENSVLSKFLHDSKLNAGEAFSEPEYLLMRFIDDFIFISFSLEHAQKFLNRMRRGFVFYNCYMNDSKYGFNFCAGNSEPSSNRLYRGDDGVSFMPWSGLLINCETLEIQADYTRYLDITIISTITVKMHSSTKYIHSKLCHYMRPKCHPIFYDSNINSPGTIRVNIYQAFLLCAMKFHCYIRSISDANVSKLELLQVIKRTFRYMHSLIVRRMQDVELHYNVRPVLKLRRKETIWLGLTAYIRVLQQKQSRYKDMLTLLTAELGRYCHLGHECDTLRYAVDDSHSSMFWKFKF